MVYLDANATSRLRPTVRTAVNDLIASDAMNPSSVHSSGRAARSQLRKARNQLMASLGLQDERIIFTSGGTEACNSLVFGFLDQKSAGRIVSSQIEHPAILACLEELTKSGFVIDSFETTAAGVAQIDSVQIDSSCELVCLMAANNETGAIQPIVELSRKIRKAGYQGPIVSDFTQAVLKSELKIKDLFEAGVDAVSISGHKLGALPGIGAIIINSCDTGNCRQFNSLLLGGPQEERFRAGTENLPGIISLSTVLPNPESQLQERASRRELRELLFEKISELNPQIKRLGPDSSKTALLSNTLMLHTPGFRGDDLVVALDLEGIQLSTGSACASGKQESSHVVQAMGLDEAAAREVIRFSLDWDTTEADIELAVRAFNKVYSRQSNLKPLNAEGARANV